MITAMVDTEAERQDVLSAFRSELGSRVPFQVLVQGRITDHYPSGWAGARVPGYRAWERPAETARTGEST